jgi:hypothetical protein
VLVIKKNPQKLKATPKSQDIVQKFLPDSYIELWGENVSRTPQPGEDGGDEVADEATRAEDPHQFVPVWG